MSTKDKGGGGGGASGSGVGVAEKALVRDLKAAAAPDTTRGFADAKDAAARLLPFHVFSDHQPCSWRGYSQAVARGSLFLAALEQSQHDSGTRGAHLGNPGKLGNGTDDISLRKVSALAMCPGWREGDRDKVDASVNVGLEAEGLVRMKRQRLEEERRRLESRVVWVRRRLEEVGVAWRAVAKGRDEGQFRGEEALMLAQWLVAEEREDVAELRARAEARLQAEQQRQREAQAKLAQLRYLEAEREAAEEQARQEQQKDAQEDEDEDDDAEADGGDSWLDMNLGSSASRAPKVTPPTQRTGSSGQRGGSANADPGTSDLLVHLARMNQAALAQDSAMGGPGLTSPPMSSEDLMAWPAPHATIRGSGKRRDRQGRDADGEVDADLDAGDPADWLGGQGMMDLNLDVAPPVPGVSHGRVAWDPLAQGIVDEDSGGGTGKSQDDRMHSGGSRDGRRSESNHVSWDNDDEQEDNWNHAGQ